MWADAPRGVRQGLEALAAAVPIPIAGIALRVCPELPPTTEERIADNRAQTVADSVMYRQALATAAQARGWAVCWYDRACVRRCGDGAGLRRHQRAAVGDGTIGRPPWQAKHKLAAAAALAAPELGRLEILR